MTITIHRRFWKEAQDSILHTAHGRGKSTVYMPHTFWVSMEHPKAPKLWKLTCWNESLSRFDKWFAYTMCRLVLSSTPRIMTTSLSVSDASTNPMTTRVVVTRDGLQRGRWWHCNIASWMILDCSQLKNPLKTQERRQFSQKCIRTEKVPLMHLFAFLLHSSLWGQANLCRLRPLSSGGSSYTLGAAQQLTAPAERDSRNLHRFILMGKKHWRRM